jgi:seryl-tRNA synthetase
MPSSTDVVRELRSSHQLWEPAAGLISLRGDALRLYRWLDDALRLLAMRQPADEWEVPPAIAFATLSHADYFASFPQWLTATAHLGASDAVLEQVANADDPADAAVSALQPCATALQPAVCYHVYAALHGQTLTAPHTCTLSGTCWRHEVGRFAPLERGWAFKMREIVCVGGPGDVAELRSRGIEEATSLAHRLGLRHELVQATDPFFAPTARGRALLQRVRALKHELMLPLGNGRTVAAASFNDHAQFFGEAFNIKDADGALAASGCSAFGIERWLLAVLVEHGTDPRNWPVPALQTAGTEEETWSV